mmetsp:Transcript_42292/g.47251  ORF Transcript_42292/g.47251 Transcript_42292/m.47251 type:complete len:84 (-) Transcript_42292:97-348(-)
MLLYSPSDEFYNEADELSSFMVDRGGDVDMIQDVRNHHTKLKSTTMTDTILILLQIQKANLNSMPILRWSILLLTMTVMGRVF